MIKNYNISDEGSFLKRAVSVCFNKNRLKIIIFLKLRETSIEKGFYEREDENYHISELSIQKILIQLQKKFLNFLQLG